MEESWFCTQFDCAKSRNQIIILEMKFSPALKSTGTISKAMTQTQDQHCVSGTIGKGKEAQ